MKILLNVTLGELANRINRQVLVDENIGVMDLCESLIISMNGHKIPIYELEYNKVVYYPYPVYESKNEKCLENVLLKDLKLKKSNHFTLEYNFENDYYFEIVVDNIYESNDKSIFKVVSGQGYGLLDDKDVYHLKSLFTLREDYLKKTEKEYLEKTFNLEECNKEVALYMENKADLFKPKRYVFNVSLYGFEKEIKRKIVVDNDVLIDDFCRYVVLAMNGDLSHSYGVKIGKEYLEEYYENLELFYLKLKEKQRLKIIYDWGDHWIFNLSLSKIIDDYGNDEFEVISGKGYGIIDDVGGTWGLANIFNGEDTSWGDYDINDFDLEKCQERIRNQIRSEYEN